MGIIVRPDSIKPTFRRCKAEIRLGHTKRHSLAGTAVSVLGVLTGCTPKASPSVPLFGAFFPSWLLCAVIGIIGSVILRAIFIRSGMDDQLPWRSIVYVSIAATIAFGVSLFVYGR
ncbi:hypothetical protein HFN68_32425 [Rhizobium laguerreae]|uniref:YtcA family lipoprotein n=1 Tax=Rhizobium laguerreae TaxID=1076926 RepID=UPI001C90A2E3|nr:YtcA family lipoprotein [Rhizobium laguerreae]MBY3537552.1 hypothetical protein [Rhizobium laguerreae]